MAVRNTIRHSMNVGTVRDLGPLAELPKMPYNGAGHPRDVNPFDEGVRLSFETGQARSAYVDNIDSARVLIRRAAKHLGIGVTIVPTLADDGATPVIAYQAHDLIKGRGRKKTTPKDATESDTSDTPIVPIEQGKTGNNRGRRR
jgi:hypothetical protein